jgi:predicted aconitase
VRLTGEQRDVLRGDAGPLLGRYMRWLVAWGEAMGAERLVPVRCVHAMLRTPSSRGCSRGTVDQYIVELREVCAHRVRCRTTTQVHSAGSNYWRESGASEVEVAFEIELRGLARRAGFQLTRTCTPYLVGNAPLKGEICAWTESSAVVCANSVLGARTTRHGMESSLAAALLGVTPEFGELLDENRRAEIEIDVAVELKSAADYGALGFYASAIAESRTPIFTGIERLGAEEAKQISASLPYAESAISMFHVAGITPEAPDLDTACGRRAPRIRRTFTANELPETYQSMTNLSRGDQVDSVILGCPFASLWEIQQIAEGLAGHRVADGLQLWIATSYPTAAESERLGYAALIHQSGGRLIHDACPGSAAILGCRSVVTNSFKQAHHAATVLGSRTAVASAEVCIETAKTGRLS